MELFIIILDQTKKRKEKTQQAYTFSNKVGEKEEEKTILNKIEIYVRDTNQPWWRRYIKYHF